MSGVIVAMSGGVDSTAAALKLLQDGYEVIGLTLRMFDNDVSGQAIDDARKVCDLLNIEHKVMEVASEFDHRVVTGFCDYYLKGLTPSPCLKCNPYFKWKKMLDADMAGKDKLVATGHYAGIRTHNGVKILCRSPGKDQSYFLHRLPREYIQRTLFPIGDMQKPDVRQLVADAGLHVASRPDSQEVCFIKGRYSDFLSDRLENCPPPGDIIDTSGKKRGHHKGLHHYTVGQRSGLGIAAPHPLYVLKLDVHANQLVVGSKSEVYSTVFQVKELVWSAITAPETALECLVQVRYRHTPTACQVTPLENGRYQVELLDPVGAVIAPGQGAAFYQGDIVLGGGEICRDGS